MLQTGGDVGQQDEFAVLIGRGQARGEAFKHPQFRRQRPAIIHVDFIFAGPMERFARRDLQSFQINFVFAVKVQVRLGEILPHHAHQPDGREKAGREGRVAGRAAQQARVFRLGSFDGIQGRRANNQDAHFSFKLRVQS